MERVTISLEDDLLAGFDSYIAGKGYRNRSEAVRDLIRHRLEQERSSGLTSPHSIGCISYVYNHHQRELAKRLMATQHMHHDVVVSALHMHLDHDNCFEVTLLRGPTRDVRRFSEALMAETGVRHGNLNLISVDVADTKHRHGNSRAHAHMHMTPTT